MTPARLILDLQVLQPASRDTGIARYGHGLAGAIARQCEGDDLLGLQNAAMPLATGEGRSLIDGLIARDKIAVFAGLPGTAGGLAIGAARSDASDVVRDAHIALLRPDVVHIADPFAGFDDDTVVGTVRAPRPYLEVATVSDFAGLDEPGQGQNHREWFGSRLARLRQADLILATSDHVRRRAITLGFDDARIVTIRGGTSKVFRPLDMTIDEHERVLSEYGISKPFVLHVDGLEPRENAPGLIEAFGRMNPSLRDGHQIVLAAAPDEARQAQILHTARQAGVDPTALVFAGLAPEHDLVRLYNLCAVFACPSFAEGRGFRPLDAMRCGSVAIGSATTGAAEVIGDADLLFDPHDRDEIAAVLSRALGDESFRRRKRDSLRLQQQRFSWDDSAKSALSAIREARARRRSQSARPIVSVPRYVLGPHGLDDALASEMARRPGLLVLPNDGARAYGPAGRDAAYRARGYAAILSGTGVDRISVWRSAPGVLGTVSAEEIEADAETFGCALHAASASLDALARAAGIARTPTGRLVATQLANALADTLPRTSEPRIFVDVTELAKNDARSGVQRVARNIVKHLLIDQAVLRIEPIREQSGVFRYARAFTTRLLDIEPLTIEDAVVDFQPSDRFIGLDLNILMSDQAFASLERHRRRGLSVWFVVYDLLPLLLPACFHPQLSAAFHRWIERLASLADGLAAISRSVANELGAHLNQIAPDRGDALRISVFNLGGDLDGDAPTMRGRAEQASPVAALDGRPYFLKVGTLEPRKGHGQLVDAFDLLWRDDNGPCLVLVGKAGWLTDDLQDRIRRHAEFGKRLFWLSDAGDEELGALYASATAVIQASYGEGYGLPLVEAARHGKPIIARDIPVFRELAEGHAAFFAGQDPADIARTISEWLAMHPARRPASAGLRWITWQSSASDLLDATRDDRSGRIWLPGGTWTPFPIHPDLASELVSGRAL